MKRVVRSLILTLCGISSVYFIGCENKSINNMKEQIVVEAKELEDGRYSFHTFVKLGNEKIKRESLIEVNMIADVKKDYNTDKYILYNPQLDILTDKCDLYETDSPKVGDDEFVQMVQVGVNETDNKNYFKEWFQVSFELEDENKGIFYIY